LLIVPSGMVVLQRITPSRLTPDKFAPDKSAPVKFVAGISELISLVVVDLTLLPSNPYQINAATTIMEHSTNFIILPFAKKIILFSGF
jgi:hypothetical protein